VFTVKFHRHRLCAFPLRLTTASGPVYGTLLANTADLWRPQRLARRRALRITFPAPNRISLPLPSVLSWCRSTNSRSLTMEWTTPQHEEIDLNCEISSYANAEI